MIVKKKVKIKQDLKLPIEKNTELGVLKVYRGKELVGETKIINTEDIKHCFLKAENPIALLRGNKTLADYKVMNGTRITFVEGEQ